jgi:tRNA(Ile)-lysidine synthase TilS/MesJ
MAFTMGIPLYMFCQKDITEEGLVESKLDWYVQKIEINESELDRTEIRQSLNSWVNERVKTRNKSPKFLETIKGETKISNLKLKEIFSALAVLSAAFSVGVACAKMFPNVF